MYYMPVFMEDGISYQVGGLSQLGTGFLEDQSAYPMNPPHSSFCCHPQLSNLSLSAKLPPPLFFEKRQKQLFVTHIILMTPTDGDISSITLLLVTYGLALFSVCQSHQAGSAASEEPKIIVRLDAQALNTPVPSANN